MKLFEMEGFLRGKCIPRDLKVNETNAEYLVRKFAEADAMCAALAAENAGLKHAVEFATAPDMWEELGGNVMRYQYQEWYADRLRSAMETPATDAFMAEVRAQGVESFAESQKEYVRKNRDELDSMTRAAYCGSAVDAERFAAQLRKGVRS